MHMCVVAVAAWIVAAPCGAAATKGAGDASLAGRSPGAAADLRAADALSADIERFYYQWNFVDAFAAATRQLELRLRHLPGDHPDVAASFHWLGSITRLSGNKTLSLRTLRYTDHLRRAILDPHDPGVVATMLELARSERENGNPDLGRELTVEAFEIATSYLGEDNLVTASAYHAMGMMHRGRLPLDEVVAYYQHALEIRERLLGDTHPVVVDNMCWLGHILQSAGRHEEALAMFHRAYSAAWNCDVDRLGVMLPLLGALSTMERERGDPERGLELRARAGELMEELRVRSPLWLGIRRLTGAVQNRLADWQRESGDPSGAWETVEENTGWLTKITQMVRRAAVENGQSERHRRLRLRVAEAEAAFTVHGTFPAMPVWLEYFQAESDLMRFERDLMLAHTRHRTLLADVQRILGDDEAIIGWYTEVNLSPPGGRSVWAYVVRNHGDVAWERLQTLGSDDVFAWRRRHAELYDLIRSAAAWPQRVPNDPVVTRKVRERGRLIYEPIARHLTGVSRVYVTSVNLGSGVPFELMQDSDGRYIDETMLVSYIVSASQLVRARTIQPDRRADRSNALVIGDPAYDGVEVVSAPASASDLSTPAGVQLDATLIRSVLDGDEDISTLPRLPMARRESERIAALFKNARLLVDINATADALAAETIGEASHRFNAVHVATHALPHPLDANRSAIVLAPGTHAHDSNAFVTTRQVQLTWDLDAEVVTLSGCQTGRGPGSPTDGSVGFVQALFAAGAHSIVTSEWEVDDVATALLMVRFYENLEGAYTESRDGHPAGTRLPKAVALREAKQWLRALPDDEGGHPFEHPAYWAGFVLIGDPD